MAYYSIFSTWDIGQHFSDTKVQDKMFIGLALVQWTALKLMFNLVSPKHDVCEILTLPTWIEYTRTQFLEERDGGCRGTEPRGQNCFWFYFLQFMFFIHANYINFFISGLRDSTNCFQSLLTCRHHLKEKFHGSSVLT